MPRPHTPKPPYPAQFRQQMVELVQAGRKPSELAKEFNCHTTSILSWVRQSVSAQPTHLEQELIPGDSVHDEDHAHHGE